jgi:hypothetical protein
MTYFKLPRREFVFSHVGTPMSLGRGFVKSLLKRSVYYIFESINKLLGPTQKLRARILTRAQLLSALIFHCQLSTILQYEYISFHCTKSTFDYLFALFVSS